MRLAAPVVLIALLCACGSSSSQTTLTREQLLDPQSCKGCQPDQFSEWEGSMHAYASTIRCSWR